MAIEHVDPKTPSDRIAEILARDGCAVIDGLESKATFDRIREELASWFELNAGGHDDFSGHHTSRTGGLIARSPASRDVIANSLVVDVVRHVLEGATGFHIHLTQVIAIGADETPQLIHRDQWAFDFFPFPRGFEVQCNSLWAMTDFTEENGATRVVPGSHQLPEGRKFSIEDTEPALMEAGSVLLYTGSLYHGGGPNRTQATRYGMNATYARSWLRQEENQYLSVPHDIARTLPKPLLRLMGYARGGYALGYIDDLRDPIRALDRGDGDEASFGDLEAAPDHAGAES